MKGRPEPGIGADLTMPAARPMRARRAQRRLSADGLWTASPPPFSLRTRYCGSSAEALTVRPAAVVSEVILRSTTPGVSSLPCELQTTLSPGLKSSLMVWVRAPASMRISIRGMSAPPMCATCGQPGSEALGGPEHEWECRNEACPEFGQPIRRDEPEPPEPAPRPDELV